MKWGLYLLILLLLVERIYNFIHFNLGIVDSDQPLFWLGATEMFHGHFHEPSVYGQSYNTFFESFIALPLIYFKIPTYIALPIVSNILTLLTILGFVNLAVKHQNMQAGWILLAYFLSLPAEFMFITSMPRGFITGIFLAATGIFYLEKSSTKRVWPGGILLGFSVILNPNALLLIAPYGLFKFKTWYHKKQLPELICAQILPAICMLGNSIFYKEHPDYIIHPAPKLSYNINYLLSIFSETGAQKFYGFGPFVYYAGPLILLLMLAVTLYAKRHNKSVFYILLFILITTPLLFGFSKIQDGEQSVFFPASRMFLALPFLLAFALIFLKPLQISLRLFKVVNFLILLWVIIKCQTISLRVERAGIENGNIVVVERHDDLLGKLNQLISVAQKNHATQCIIGIRNDFYTYGIPAVSDLKQQTIGAAYERRYWSFDEFPSSGNQNIIYVGNNPSARFPLLHSRFITKCSEDSIFLIDKTERHIVMDTVMMSIKVQRKNFIKSEKL